MKRKQKEFVIWQNYDINVEDYKEWLDEEFPDADENERYELCIESNDEQLDCERMNLDKILASDIICLADIGLWNGRKCGYKMIGQNLNSVLQFMNDCDYAEFFCDTYNVCSRQSHHDGTHYLTYRQLKPNLSEQQIENFLDKILEGKLTSRDISRCTKSVRPLVAEVYGW